MINSTLIHSYNRDYKIYVDKGLRFQLKEIITDFNFSKIAIVTDENVAHLYLNDVQQALNDMDYVTLVLEPGEKIKTLHYFEKLHSFLLDNQMDRHSAIIALGGGVIGDLAGFVAATYMRGIGFVQMPTTLLAHDSSIGGKVAINLNETKNVIGSFYPPNVVIYDVDTLQSLDSQQKRSGFSEMVKHGWIADDKYLNELQSEMTDHITLDHPNFKELLLQSMKIKQSFIESDEKELNIRKYLNFGHTLGHAIESYCSNRYTHGECVMFGMLFSLFLSDYLNNRVHLFDDEYINWIKTLNYPLNILDQFSHFNELINKMSVDKKNTNSKINMVLLKDIGSPYMHAFMKEEIKRLLKDFNQQIKRFSK